MEIFIAVILTLIILIFFVLMLNIPFGFTVTSDEKIHFSFSVFGKKTKKKEKQETQEKPDILKLSKFIFSERQGIFQSLKYLLKKAVVKDFKLHITASTSDAAQTAMLYGGLCSILYPAVAFLETVMTVKEDDIKINADYENFRSYFFLSANIKIRVFYILKAFLKVLPIVKKITKEENKND